MTKEKKKSDLLNLPPELLIVITPSVLALTLVLIILGVADLIRLLARLVGS